MKKIILSFSILVFALGVIKVFANPSPFPGQLAVNILQAPTPLVAQGKDFLVYEIYLTNFSSTPVTLSALQITGPSDHDKKFNFSQQDFAKLINPIGVKQDNTPLQFNPGVTKMLFVWLPYDSLTAMPNQLTHHFSYNTVRDNQNLTFNENTEPLAINKSLPIVMSAPLKGDYWIAANGPSNTSEHRKANMVIHGYDYFAQRYAIDFVQTNKAGVTYQGDEHKNQSYLCYGKDILSVLPGKVIDIKNGIPENIPHSPTTAVPIDINTIGGNYVLIDIGHGAYAFYAHLIPGSIKVKVGDKVSRGEVVAKLGNSGNSTEPHLHFHVVNKPAVLAAEGIPYAFDNFYLRHDANLQHEINQLVLENAVVKFPE